MRCIAVGRLHGLQRGRRQRGRASASASAGAGTHRLCLAPSPHPRQWAPPSWPTASTRWARATARGAPTRRSTTPRAPRSSPSSRWAGGWAGGASRGAVRRGQRAGLDVALQHSSTLPPPAPALASMAPAPAAARAPTLAAAAAAARPLDDAQAEEDRRWVLAHRAFVDRQREIMKNVRAPPAPGARPARSRASGCRRRRASPAQTRLSAPQADGLLHRTRRHHTLLSHTPPDHRRCPTSRRRRACTRRGGCRPPSASVPGREPAPPPLPAPPALGGPGAPLPCSRPPSFAPFPVPQHLPAPPGGAQ